MTVREVSLWPWNCFRATAGLAGCPESVSADGVLRVRVATAPWATELSLMTPRILARVNAGRQGRINPIRWIAGPLGRPTL